LIQWIPPLIERRYSKLTHYREAGVLDGSRTLVRH
jgi:hypothetical protein